MGSTSYFASAISLKTGFEIPVLNDENVKVAIMNELRKELARPVHKKDLFLSGSLIHINEVSKAVENFYSFYNIPNIRTKIHAIIIIKCTFNCPSGTQNPATFGLTVTDIFLRPLK